MAEAVISYPGAKWRFYPYMVEYFPLDMKTFIEPFFGGGSVTLSVADDARFTKLERMIGGDLYTEIWSMWQGIKTNPDAIIEIATDWFTKSCPHQEEIYNTGFIAEVARQYLPGGTQENFENNPMLTEENKQEIRDKIKLYNTAIEEGLNFWKWSQSVDTNQMSLEQRAARMILVNRISFSGMGDSGSMSKDQFTSFHLDKLNVIYQAHKLLQRVELYNQSFEETMKLGEEDPENSFIFLDPPYANQESSGLYGKNGGTHKGFPHKEFADVTKQSRCSWFVTYDDSVIVRKLFAGNTVFGKPCYFLPFKTVYTMAGKTAEDALAGEELFISNMDIVHMHDIDEDYKF